MGDNKNDDFWKSGNDDFWNKPVADKDWLNEDENSFFHSDSRQNGNNENPYLYQEQLKTQKPTDYSGLSGEMYTQTQSTWATKQHQKEKNKKKDGGKQVHIHTIICLVFIFLAVISAVGAASAIKILKNQAAELAKKLDYEEIEVGDCFQYNDNNKAYLEDAAYTIVTEEDFKGFPKGMKLIAVYVKVESDEYVRDGYAFKNCYAGFEEEGNVVYKKPAGESLVYSYILGLGFDKEQILSTYGIGNGFNSTGYFFFFVPEEVDEITLYMEKREENKKISMLEKVYMKNMIVLPEDGMVTEMLVERKGR